VKVVILSSLGNETARRCTGSLLETAPTADFDLHLFREKGFREQTLNHALEQLGCAEDILFIGDDIVFTEGWFEALTKNLDQADILGMTMLYPDTTKVQDRGYDLMGTGGKAALVAKDRGLDHANLKPFGFRFCDAVCGCFLYVKAEVFSRVDAFSEQGANRWGEFIFMAQARQAGFTCGVIEHYLHHGGVSTKNNPDPKLSSTSYLVEHGWWDDIVRDHVDPQWIQTPPECRLDDSLAQLLTQKGTRVLFYGAGTVSQYILNSMGENLAADLEFCSGLSEEVGMDFLGHSLKDVSVVDPALYDVILMTPLRIGEGIFHKLLEPRLGTGFSGRVLVVETRQKNQIKEFLAREIPVGP
jgi:hypothetical protein